MPAEIVYNKISICDLKELDYTHITMPPVVTAVALKISLPVFKGPGAPFVKSVIGFTPPVALNRYVLLVGYMFFTTFVAVRFGDSVIYVVKEVML
jgi:hypothetical protein